LIKVFSIAIALNHFSSNKWISRLKNDRSFDEFVNPFLYFNVISKSDIGEMILDQNK